MNTKFSKTFVTYFFPVGASFREEFDSWVRYLKEELLWGNDDPLFPKTNVILGDSNSFKADGFKREHWATATPIREIFRKAFEVAGLPYFNPHSFRNTLASLGQSICQTPEEFKAWSQNLGHESVMTTFHSYGEVQVNRQAEILKELTKPREVAYPNADILAEAVARRLQNFSM